MRAATILREDMRLSQTQDIHQEQIDYWNGPAGLKWLTQVDQTDAMLAPILGPALDAAQIKPGEHVLDVGCGCGASTVELSQRVGPIGRVLAVDVSVEMLALARHRTQAAGNTECIAADAAAYDFAPGQSDLLFSRFGVMFFGDPAAAFTNMRKALKPNGRVLMACWRPINENGWMDVPLRAAYQHVPRMPRPEPEAPGPFSFSDPARVTRILTAAGFSAPVLTPLDVMLDIATGHGLDAAVTSAATIGATSRALQDQPDDLRSAALAEIKAALMPHVQGNCVPLPGAVWLISAACA